MHNYKELLIWKKAIAIARECYKVSEAFPKSESFGLTQQLRRASVSVSSNIAEGAGRNTENEFYHFLGIAKGSLFEVQSQLYLSIELEFIEHKNCEMLLSSIEELIRMIHGFQSKIRSTLSEPVTEYNITIN